MPNIFIDGIETPFETGETILPAVIRSGQQIPHYCYHPGLAITAQCRQCLVEVTDMGNGNPMAKLQTACSTPAADGMHISTQSTMATEGQKLVNEFLLINHPLDCPICDQAGECDLQNFAFRYGSGHSEMDYEKRTYGWRKVGTFIALERNRCIHCSRCERFSKDLAGTHDFASFLRSHELTFDTFQDTLITHKFQGNLADICPVGCITTLDWRFKKRAWKFKKTESICTGCSTGCNISLEHHQNRIFRIKPRENAEVNHWWMCDAGRLNFKHLNNQTNRIDTPLGRVEGEMQEASWQAAYDAFAAQLKDVDAKAVIALADTHSSNEELHLLGELMSALGASPKQSCFVPHQQDRPFEAPPPLLGDSFLYQLIRTDFSPNINGAQALGWQSSEGDSTLKKALSNHPTVWIVVGNPFIQSPIEKILNPANEKNGTDESNGLAELEKIDTDSSDDHGDGDANNTTLPEYITEAVKQSDLILWIGTHHNAWSTVADLVLPARTVAEKYGTFVNRQGRIQRFAPAIPAPEKSCDQIQILQSLQQLVQQNSHQAQHGLEARDILPLLPTPFPALNWEKVGQQGVLLNSVAP